MLEFDSIKEGGPGHTLAAKSLDVVKKKKIIGLIVLPCKLPGILKKIIIIKTRRWCRKERGNLSADPLTDH